MFHPLVEKWFAEEVGNPTEVQRRGWEAIASGSHVLATAPTGSGKTLAAFLWSLNQFLTGAWTQADRRVVYISPLKALGNDVRRNLLGPLDELQRRFRAAGLTVPEVQVGLRTGDTPGEERRRMARRPPHILITTPESLNLMLTSAGGRDLLKGVATVILDEIHAVAATKRGAQLAFNLERLASLAGEVQRIALSATVHPLDRIARWVAGRTTTDGQNWSPRTMKIIDVPDRKTYDLSVRFPAGSPEGPGSFWGHLIEEIRGSLRRNRSTLVFANSRRMVEKLTRLVNEAEGQETIYAHHGSLSREIRQVVEERLKTGQLRGIAATNSLELGLDIGHLDEVLLVQTPPSLASAAQRIGRAGHRVGETSRAVFLPFVSRDLLRSAVTARSVVEGFLEPLVPVENPLDVLAQTILSLVATESWGVDEMFQLVRGADPFFDLPRRHFDLILDLLQGRYAGTRLRDLRPQIAVDPDGTVRGLPGVARKVYTGGGTIPDRGYFHLRREGSSSLIGELDEEFVWERKIGDAFTLGVQTWRIERITHNDVFVTPTRGAGAMAPFWRAEARDRGFELSGKIGEFLEWIEPRLEDPALPDDLTRDYSLDSVAGEELIRFLNEQRHHCGGVLPHRRRLVVEKIREAKDGRETYTLVLHTLWGGRVNRPLAMALAGAWEERHGSTLEIMHEDDCVAINAAEEIDAAEILHLVRPENVERLLIAQLENSGYFGARFREAAGCSLILPRESYGRRTPLWLSRQRAKTLLAAVRRWDDFPLRLEAFRSCMREGFDLPALRQALEELADGTIETRVVSNVFPSPFASEVFWKRTNELMYEDDVPLPGQGPRPRGSLLRELVFTSHLRPRLSRDLIDELERKLQRTAPGYAPRTAVDLGDWVGERILIPEKEWRELLAAAGRDGTQDVETWPTTLASRVVPWRWSGEEGPVCFAARGWEPGDAEARVELVSWCLRYYGPIEPQRLAALYGFDSATIEEALAVLADQERVVIGELALDEPGLLVCDTENLERLLRLTRARARPSFEPRPIGEWPGFLGVWQGLGGKGEGPADLKSALEKLFGFPAAAEAWESDILPARLSKYTPAWMDALFAETELAWSGCGFQMITFFLPGEGDLFSRELKEEGRDGAASLFPEGGGRLGFEDLLAFSKLPSGELTRRLWECVWQGAVTNDGFAAVRRGLESGFAPSEPPAVVPGGRRPRARFDRWRGTRPFTGGWTLVPAPAEPQDALEREELNKERARVLLDRYGILFRELLAREVPALQWPALFRTLRLMELAGEVLLGQFFLGIPGPQFASPAALRVLEEGPAGKRVWWLNAGDPASPCGTGLESLAGGFPRRLATTHLAFLDGRLAVISERSGKRLTINLPPDHPRLAECLEFLRTLMNRPVLPWRSIAVETINGEHGADSPYREAMDALFHTTKDSGRLILNRRYS